MFGVGGDEVEAITFFVDPVVGGLCAAIGEPCLISGADVERDLCDQAAAAREDGDAQRLIFLNRAAGFERVHCFGEDGIGECFEREALHVVDVDRAEEGWILRG